MGTPCLSNSIAGTAERGARSENADSVLASPGRVPAAWGGDDEGRMPVEDVGMGVG